MKLAKRLCAAALCGTLLLGTAGCSTAKAETSASPIEKRKVIIDTDTGGDDAAALLMALANDSIEILGITVLAGNVSLEQAAANALMTVEMAGKDTPVYPGATTNLMGEEKPTFSIFGEDGMGDQGLIHPTRKAETKSAVDFIIETVEANPEEIEFISLGPMTNLALALQKQSGIAENIKHVWFMGSAGLGAGNATPVAEFNVYKDAHACQAVLQAGIPMTIMGYDICDAPDLWLLEADFARLKKGGKACQFVDKAFTKIIENKLAEYGTFQTNCCDATLMACFLWPELMKSTITTHAECITDSGCLAYGQVLYYQQGVNYENGITFDRYNAALISGMDCPAFKDKLFEALESLN